MEEKAMVVTGLKVLEENLDWEDIQWSQTVFTNKTLTSTATVAVVLPIYSKQNFAFFCFPTSNSN
ncbi:hypothetical protein OSB04_002723 [Centaurea solstitialis]|uniref:Uncharacterized protein n=1 Tax=Centaurea solstitialis TaxID=347529 RepID=A0AA38UB23_9ASTR|nr:hypothetical protein OSB04_002723 [Centaurea solstitialis]